MYKEYLLSKPEAELDYPFGPDVAVFKVAGKMFATLSFGKVHPEFDACDNMNLKCSPEQAIELRDIFAAVVPGYHMNKKHWNTVVLNGSVPEGEIKRMIDMSYALVVAGLPKAKKVVFRNLCHS
ncbi:hypothetical protein DS2_18880, partial [Catenovulum agarivorans DS-2]